MTTCTFCQAPGELHQVESPAIRVCTACREKLQTHLAIICTGCDTLHWLRKTPQNVMIAAEMTGCLPQHIIDNPMMQAINSCQQCYKAAEEFTVRGAVRLH